MKTERLDEFLKNNREGFDIHTPSPAIWNRIAGRRKKAARVRTLLSISYKVAASIGIFILSYAYHEYRGIRSEKIADNAMDERLYEALPELKETEYYYSNLVDKKISELKPLLVNIPEIQDELSSDLSELDSMYISLKKDLLDNISNEEVLEAMVQNYRIKLKILEELTLQIMNEKKTAPNENGKINI